MERQNRFSPLNSRNRQEDVPFWIGILLFFSKTTAVIGLVFTIVGIIISYSFFISVFSPAQKDIEDEDPVTESVVTLVIPTNTSINGSTIYKYHYEFKTMSGEKVESSAENFAGIAEKGDTLLIQYNPDNPKETRLMNLDEINLDWILYFTLLFVAIGIILMIFPIKDIIKKITIIKNGQIVYGKYAGKKATNVRINNSPVYRMFFKFTVSNGREYKIEAKTHRTQILQDGEKEPIIFDIRNPEDAFPIDFLPKPIKKFLQERFRF